MAGSEARLEKMQRALREAGVRITRQRMALLQVLAETRDHPDANELHRRARAVDTSISVSTVYRTLSTLEGQGILHRHTFEGEPARYEPADMSHHDHIIDVDTGKVTEFRSDKIEQLQAEIAAEHGYDVVKHRLELYCRRRKPS